MSAKPTMSVPAARSYAPLRPISFGDPAVIVDRRNGTIYLRPKMALGEYPLRLTDRLHHWAKTEPNRIFMAERAMGGGWRQISYAQLLASSRHIASGLLARGLSAEKPIVVLSGNSIDHALLASSEHPVLDAAHDAIGPDSIAKFLLTSGSTGNPKAVINTQRMICANQVMLRETLAFLKDEPPVIVDWLPWNHTFGGNHNIGLTLYNGGSMYLDAGKPMPGGIEETVRNLREISPTVYFNVPKGYEALLPYLRDDSALRAKFFHRLHAMFFSGAALSPYVWNGLDELAVAETGFRVPVLTGLGATETAPFFMSVRPATSRSGHVGLPVSGNEAKLVPVNGKLEVRARGPNVTPGYWRQPELTAAAFDDEGFYKFGDAIKPADPKDFSAGFDFDGRIAEDFKLASGTWVSVGPLRARFIAACAPMVRDVVIAGINRDEVSALVILDLDGCRLINPTLAFDDLAATVADPLIRDAFRERFFNFLATATGSSTRITRAILIDTPLSIDRGEVTDKGSINQRAVLEHRSALIEELYSPTPPAHVITLG